jgi:long-chain acyl-CoA synthetase
MTNKKKQSTEAAVREIRRRTRRKFAPEEKVRIVIEGLRGEQISHMKCPRSVDFEAELPRHPTGKLYKRLLKDRYWGKQDSRIV